jgi:hypothetical protein
MDNGTIIYIKTHFRHLMFDDEKLVLQYHLYMLKPEDNLKIRQIMAAKGWDSESSAIQACVEKGYSEFELKVVQRIMTETPEKVFLNNCPKCSKLARTPYAKQCRYCGYSWHNL